MLIIGAGISGLLAGHYFRHTNCRILEKQSKLPNNHKALLRFRTDSVSQLTAIPFKKVQITKEIYGGTGLKANNMYSQKLLGKVTGRSITAEVCDRYIAPEDFIQKLANGLNISYDTEVESFTLNEPIISTMPTWDLASLLDYDLEVELKTLPIWTSTCYIGDCDVYQTIYFPDLNTDLYRASITGNKLILEYKREYIPTRDYINTLLGERFGIRTKIHSRITTNHQKYGKLVECDGDEVRQFIRHATENFGIYSLGRWALHRQVLADDVVNDLKVIGRIIESGGYRG